MIDWYQDSFGVDYLRVYKHRDRYEAIQQIRNMVDWLELPVGSRVLDLCCGAGRHALALAEMGYRMTAVDLSLHLLKEAREADSDHQITWIQSDMRWLPDEITRSEKFDAVVNVFTSFGYFNDDEEQIQVLQQIHKVLKPQGRYMIDLINEGYIQEHLVPWSQREVDGISIIEKRSLNDGFVVKEIQMEELGSLPRQYWERVKLYSLPQMENMLRRTGLRIDQVYGDDQGTLYDSRESPRMIIIGHRE